MLRPREGARRPRSNGITEAIDISDQLDHIYLSRDPEHANEKSGKLDVLKAHPKPYVFFFLIFGMGYERYDMPPPPLPECGLNAIGGLHSAVPLTA